MATDEQLSEVKALAALVADDGISDANLMQKIDAGGIASTVAWIYNLRAAKYSRLVNVSESGSSRSLGDLYKNAMSLGKYWEGVAAAPAAPDLTMYARTSDAVRES